MLKHLYISNYILIESLEFDFSDGFMVVTGETGAGKSIFIGALSLLLGQRLNKEVVGPFSDKTQIDGIFEFDLESKELSILNEAGFVDDEFIFSRVIDNNGKSVYRINRQIVTLNFVKEVLEDSIDIHSQFNTQALLNEKYHLDFIDQLIEDKSLISTVRDLYFKYQNVLKDKEEFIKTQLSPFELEVLEKEVHYLENLNLSENEDESILNELKQLTEYKQSLTQTYQILNTLDELDYSSLYSIIESSQKNDVTDLIRSAYFQLDEAHQEVARMVHSSEFDEDLFNKLNERSYEINQVKRRLKMDINEILEYIEISKQKIEDSRDIERAINRFDKLISEAYDDFTKEAQSLSAIRQTVSSSIENFVVLHAQDLNMKDISFKVEFINHESSRGLESAQFLVSMNKNIKADVLSKVASGGELSRLMLILKILFNMKQPQKLIIFDEIDTGVSGKVAQLMGQKMVALSKQHRLLAVTHLPLVAAFGDRHFKVIKSDESTVYFKELNKQERLDELAILLGSEINENTLLAAKDLLSQTQELSK